MLSRGITLLELLVTLAVIGVIAAVALPAYQQHMRRVNRADATTALFQLVAAEESYHLRHGRYTSSIDAPPPAGLGARVTSEHGAYRLEVALAADSQSFIATATPTLEGGQAADRECLAFSLDHRGRRAVSGTGDAANCWR